MQPTWQPAEEGWDAEQVLRECASLFSMAAPDPRVATRLACRIHELLLSRVYPLGTVTLGAPLRAIAVEDLDRDSSPDVVTVTDDARIHILHLPDPLGALAPSPRPFRVVHSQEVPGAFLGLRIEPLGEVDHSDIVVFSRAEEDIRELRVRLNMDHSTSHPLPVFPTLNAQIQTIGGGTLRAGPYDLRVYYRVVRDDSEERPQYVLQLRLGAERQWSELHRSPLPIRPVACCGDEILYSPRPGLVTRRRLPHHEEPAAEWESNLKGTIAGLCTGLPGGPVAFAGYESGLLCALKLNHLRQLKQAWGVPLDQRISCLAVGSPFPAAEDAPPRPPCLLVGTADGLLRLYGITPIDALHGALSQILSLLDPLAKRHRPSLLGLLLGEPLASEARPGLLDLPPHELVQILCRHPQDYWFGFRWLLRQAEGDAALWPVVSQVMSHALDKPRSAPRQDHLVTILSCRFRALAQEHKEGAPRASALLVRYLGLLDRVCDRAQGSRLRKVERLVRRVQKTWLGDEALAELCRRAEVQISLEALGARNRRLDLLEAEARAAAAAAREDWAAEEAACFDAAAAASEGQILGLTREASFNGLNEAVATVSRGADEEPRLLLVGHRRGRDLEIYDWRLDERRPARPSSRLSLPHAARKLEVGAFRRPGERLIAVETSSGEVQLMTLPGPGGRATLLDLPLTLRGPAEWFEAVPVPESLRGLVEGQDLLMVAGIDGWVSLHGWRQGGWETLWQTLFTEGLSCVHVGRWRGGLALAAIQRESNTLKLARLERVGARLTARFTAEETFLTPATAVAFLPLAPPGAASSSPQDCLVAGFSDGRLKAHSLSDDGGKLLRLWQHKAEAAITCFSPLGGSPGCPAGVLLGTEAETVAVVCDGEMERRLDLERATCRMQRVDAEEAGIPLVVVTSTSGRVCIFSLRLERPKRDGTSLRARARGHLDRGLDLLNRKEPGGGQRFLRAWQSHASPYLGALCLHRINTLLSDAALREELSTPPTGGVHFRAWAEVLCAQISRPSWEALAWSKCTAALAERRIGPGRKVHLLQCMGKNLTQLSRERALELVAALTSGDPHPTLMSAVVRFTWLMWRAEFIDAEATPNPTRPSLWLLVEPVIRFADEQRLGWLAIEVAQLVREVFRPTLRTAMKLIFATRALGQRGVVLPTSFFHALALPRVMSEDGLRLFLKEYADIPEPSTPEHLKVVLPSLKAFYNRFRDEVEGARNQALMFGDLCDVVESPGLLDYLDFLRDGDGFLAHVKELGKKTGFLEDFAELRARLPEWDPQGDILPFHKAEQLRQHRAALERWCEAARPAEQGLPSLGTLMVDLAARTWLDEVIAREIEEIRDVPCLTVRPLGLRAEGADDILRVQVTNVGTAGLLEGFGVRIFASGAGEERLVGEAVGPRLAAGAHSEVRVRLQLPERLRGSQSAARLELHHRGNDGQRRADSHPLTFPERLIAPSNEGAPAYVLDLPETFGLLLEQVQTAGVGEMLLVVAERPRDQSQLLTDLRDSLVRRKVPTLLFSVGEMLGPLYHVTNLRDINVRDEIITGFLECLRAASLDLSSAIEGTSQPSERMRALVDHIAHTPGPRPVVLVSSADYLRVIPSATRKAASRALGSLLLEAVSHVRVVVACDLQQATEIGLTWNVGVAQRRFFPMDGPWAGSRASREEVAEYLTLRNAKLVSRLTHQTWRRLLLYAGYDLVLVGRVCASLLNHLDAREKAGATLDDSTRGDGAPTRRRQHQEWQVAEEVIANTATHDDAKVANTLEALPPLHRMALALILGSEERINVADLQERMLVLEDLATRTVRAGNQPKLILKAPYMVLPKDVERITNARKDLPKDVGVCGFRALDKGRAAAQILSLGDVDALIRDLASLGLIVPGGPGRGEWEPAIPALASWFHLSQREHVRVAWWHGLVKPSELIRSLPLRSYATLGERVVGPARQAELWRLLGLIPGVGPETPEDRDEARSRWSRLLGLSRRWSDWVTHRNLATFERFCRELAELWRCTLLGPARELRGPPAAVACLDLSSLQVPGLKALAVIGVDNVNDDPRGLRNLARDSLPRDTSRESTSLTLALVLRPLSRTLEPEVASYPELVVTDESHLVSTALETRPKAGLIDLVTSRVELTRLSPYTIRGGLRGDAIADLFVGRRDELRDILEGAHKSFAIVGARRAGKTSLLAKLDTEAKERWGDKLAVFRHTCVTGGANHLEDELLRFLDASDAERSSVARHLKAFRERTGVDHVLLLLDEIDTVLTTVSTSTGSHKRVEPFFWQVRAAAQEGLCQVVVTGYLSLYRQEKHPSSPFMNWMEYRKLAAVREEEAKTLILEPLSRIDVGFSDPDLVGRVLRDTDCIPWIIQRYCHELVCELDKRERSLNAAGRRRLTSAEVERAAHRVEYELYRYLTDPQFFSPRHQIILLTLLREGKDVHASEDEVRRLLDQDPRLKGLFPQLTIILYLDDMTTTLALGVERGEYYFAGGLYPRVIHPRIKSLDEQIQLLIAELDTY